ncbi:polysaccharide deacetylase family protein [Candidatus Parcubacteria bacterium]|nr:polysaccharide deacetylase family protein [Candidatus Parcubacteria bacterium]
MTVVVNNLPGGAAELAQTPPAGASGGFDRRRFRPSKTVAVLAHCSRLADALKLARPRPSHRPLAAGLIVVFSLSLAGLIKTLPPSAPAASEPAAAVAGRQDVAPQLIDLEAQVDALMQTQAGLGVRVVEPPAAAARLRAIRLIAAAGDAAAAQSELAALRRDLAGWQAATTAAASQQAAARHHRVLAPASGSYGPVTAPILMYHYPPADFENQLKTLTAKGYSAIDLDQLTLALKYGSPLPPKPVIITFDDGFSNQMLAFDLLVKYQMKATFYIVTGGAASRYCIGANRQPGRPCGDAYLNWDEIRRLDASGLVTIGAHTVDHLALVSQTPAGRQHQIAGSKAEIEARLGHPIRHFAYPGGSFNAEVAAAVQAAGFATATTTRPGMAHPAGKLYELQRVRSAYTLP